MILYLAMLSAALLSATFNEDWITAWLIFVAFVLRLSELSGLTKM
jgi:hypothetical protein